MKKNTKNKRRFIIFGIIFIFIVVGTLLISNWVRTKKINSQVLNNVNLDEKCTTIFCSGTNVRLDNDSYNIIKEDNSDLIISNNKYIAKIKSENVESKIDLKVDIDKSLDDYIVNINSDGIVELKIKLFNYNNDYISQFDSENNLLTNEAIVDSQRYTEIELLNDNNIYRLAYIIPNEFNLQDIILNKGASKIVDLSIDKKDYTYGSVMIECDNKEAIEVNEFRITGKEVGEYTIYAKTDNTTKEAKIIVEQSVEKIELSSLTLDMIKDTQTDVTARVTPDNAVNKELEWKSTNEEIAIADDSGKIKALKEGNCEIIVSTVEEPIVSAKIQVEVKNKIISISQTYPAFSNQVEGITYINGIMIVNKNHSIPASYAPGLQTVAYNAFMDLKRAAAAEGYDISLLSGYRSYETQKNLYNNYVATYGQAEADTFSARPGTSEHQTGLAMDVGWIDDAYGDTPSGIWLAENCYKFGFIIRYPKNKENITGYKYEPWHIRYLGTDIAKDVYESGLCLEEYLGTN